MFVADRVRVRLFFLIIFFFGNEETFSPIGLNSSKILKTSSCYSKYSNILSWYYNEFRFPNVVGSKLGEDNNQYDIMQIFHLSLHKSQNSKIRSDHNSYLSKLSRNTYHYQTQPSPNQTPKRTTIFPQECKPRESSPSRGIQPSPNTVQV